MIQPTLARTVSPVAPCTAGLLESGVTTPVVVVRSPPSIMMQMRQSKSSSQNQIENVESVGCCIKEQHRVHNGFSFS
jgi:hypothetical protein